MRDFKNYDRIVVLEQDQFSYLITSDEERSIDTLPTLENDVLGYLRKNFLQNKDNCKDLIISYLKKPVGSGFNIVKELITSEAFSHTRTTILLLSSDLDKQELEETKELGIEFVITNKDEIKNILTTLKVLHKN